MKKEETIKKVRDAIAGIKSFILRLAQSRSLPDATELNLRKTAFSKFTREIYDQYGVDTMTLKYRADALVESVGQATAKISKEWYSFAILVGYARWMDRLENPHDVSSLGEITRKLISKFQNMLTGSFKEMCDKYDSDVDPSSLPTGDRRIYDEFIELGCQALLCLYDDFERVLLEKLK